MEGHIHEKQPRGVINAVLAVDCFVVGVAVGKLRDEILEVGLLERQSLDQRYCYYQGSSSMWRALQVPPLPPPWCDIGIPANTGDFDFGQNDSLFLWWRYL